MKCPACASPDTSVKQTRIDEEIVMRRRHCQACPVRFTTHEIVVLIGKRRRERNLLRHIYSMLKKDLDDDKG